MSLIKNHHNHSAGHNDAIRPGVCAAFKHLQFQMSKKWSGVVLHFRGEMARPILQPLLFQHKGRASPITPELGTGPPWHSPSQDWCPAPRAAHQPLLRCLSSPSSCLLFFRYSLSKGWVLRRESLCCYPAPLRPVSRCWY